jgi:formylglycine-generating enzyme required for sulfatase activity
MGKYEVTQEQWEAVMGDNPSSSKTKGAKLPVTDVSWNDCQDFIKKLNASTKGGYRLPTEAEWEYTCRAGTSTAYSYGDNLSMSDANTHGASIKAVGSYKPNAFGLYDMHGNVWEWCEDWYGAYSAGAVTDPRTDPRGLAPAKRRVLRGGSMLALPPGTTSRRPFGATALGSVWRGQNNYCLTPLLLYCLLLIALVLESTPKGLKEYFILYSALRFLWFLRTTHRAAIKFSLSGW